MGRRGPAPQPTVLQMLRGDPGKRAKARAKKEMRIASGLPSTPKFLTGKARAEWNRISRLYGELTANGQKLLTEADMVALACYCQAYADMLHAIEMIAKHGDVYPIRNEDGTVKYLQQSPWVAMKHKAMIAVKTFATEFGFTPSSRTRVNAGEPEWIPSASDDIG